MYLVCFFLSYPIGEWVLMHSLYISPSQVTHFWQPIANSDCIIEEYHHRRPGGVRRVPFVWLLRPWGTHLLFSHCVRGCVADGRELHSPIFFSPFLTTLNYSQYSKHIYSYMFISLRICGLWLPGYPLNIIFHTQFLYISMVISSPYYSNDFYQFLFFHIHNPSIRHQPFIRLTYVTVSCSFFHYNHC